MDINKFIKKHEALLDNSLGGRKKHFQLIIEKLVALNKPLIIVETGTLWSPLDEPMGAFTYIFGDLIKNYVGGKLITIDINPEHIKNAKQSTKEFQDVIEYVISDSVEYLESMTDKEVEEVDLFYFDSYDFIAIDPIPSQLHHLRELLAVYKRLSKNVILSVDDNLPPGCWMEEYWYRDNGEFMDKKRIFGTPPNRWFGKGTLIDCFLTNEGWERYHSYDKPEMQVLSYILPNEKDKVKSILDNFYKDKVTAKPKKKGYFSTEGSYYNPVEGLGDSIILTSILPYVKVKNSVLETIDPEFLDKTNLVAEAETSIAEMALFDWGGGHAIQRFFESLDLKSPLVPKGNLKYEGEVIKGKVFCHLSKNHKKWMNVPPDIIEQIKSYFNDNPQFTPYYFENNLDINSIIREIGSSEYFLGIDSGPMHIAAALDKKAIIAVNDPPQHYYLPYIKECDILNMEWMYPQNVHLNLAGKTYLVPSFNIENLDKAFKGEIYPYWSTEFLNIKSL